MVVPMGSKKEKRRQYTKDYRAEAVRLVDESGKSVRQVTEDLGINASSLYAWVRQARVDRGVGPAGALTTEAIVHAVAMDPLAGAVCTLKEIRDMCTEMLDAQRQWLPQFEGKSIRPTPAISIPKDCMPVDVPLDPALAVVHRFGAWLDRDTD